MNRDDLQHTARTTLQLDNTFTDMLFYRACHARASISTFVNV